MYLECIKLFKYNYVTHIHDSKTLNLRCKWSLWANCFRKNSKNFKCPRWRPFLKCDFMGLLAGSIRTLLWTFPQIFSLLSVSLGSLPNCTGLCLDRICKTLIGIFPTQHFWIRPTLSVVIIIKGRRFVRAFREIPTD